MSLTSATLAWKPQHGTNKEVWQAIVDKLNAQKAFTGFNSDISWESAKDQFIAMLDRQRRQKKKGTFASKLDIMNSKIDGQPYVDEAPDSSRKSKSAYDVDDRLKKFPKKAISSILLETTEPNSGHTSVDIGILRIYCFYL